MGSLFANFFQTKPELETEAIKDRIFLAARLLLCFSPCTNY